MTGHAVSDDRIAETSERGFTFWNDADAGVPLPVRARREIEKLGTQGHR
jgi:hypothetical protein